MSKSIARWSRTVILASFAMLAPSAANAVAIVTVKVSGKDAATNTLPFSATFSYDQDLGGTGGVFTFSALSNVHVISYQIGTYCTYTGSGPGPGAGTADPYTITTITPNAKTFTLQATTPQPPWATTVTIVMPTTATLSQSKLPGCMELTTATNCTFTLSGGMTFSGKIQSISCTPPNSQFGFGDGGDGLWPVDGTPPGFGNTGWHQAPVYATGYAQALAAPGYACPKPARRCKLWSRRR